MFMRIMRRLYRDYNIDLLTPHQGLLHSRSGFDHLDSRRTLTLVISTFLSVDRSTSGSSYLTLAPMLRGYSTAKWSPRWPRIGLGIGPALIAFTGNCRIKRLDRDFRVLGDDTAGMS